MKKSVKILFLCLSLSIFSVSLSQAQDCDDLYRQALALQKAKKYSEAIARFESAAKCNPELQPDCSKRINECKQIPDKPVDNRLSVNRKIIRIKADGGNDNVVVSGKTWTVTSSETWCNVQKKDNAFSVVCDPNETLVERKAIVKVESGNEIQITEITQEAAAEYLRVSSNELGFPPEGSEEKIQITTNAREWSYSSIPSWVEITKSGNTLIIKAKRNNSNGEQNGKFLVHTPSKELTIDIKQHAGSEEIGISKSTVNFGRKGGMDAVIVYGNTTDWLITSIPDWCNVKKEDNRTVSIESLSNQTLGVREGIVQIKAKNGQTVSVKVVQESGIQENPIIIPGPNGGSSVPHPKRNVSFGITAGLVFPSFSTDVSSGYIGSAVNYGYGDANENANYSPEMGYSVGVLVDFSLVKNFYLQTGLEYTSIKMKNKFSGSYRDEFPQTNTTYLGGTAYDEFTENYNLNYLEIPVTFSYRFKLTGNTYWQINAGAYIGYGISGKCEVEGTTDWPSLTEYYNSNDRSTGNDNYSMNCNITGDFDLFGKTGSRKDAYTTGAMSVNNYNFNFPDSPFKKLNGGISLGTSIEFGGFNLGVSYKLGLMNIANDDYWKSKRFPISEYESSTKMDGYTHSINQFQIKLAYFFR